jgi:hypothetical protein
MRPTPFGALLRENGHDHVDPHDQAGNLPADLASDSREV